MAKNQNNGGSTAIRRSTRSRFRPELFSASPSHVPQSPSLISPEPVQSSSSSNAAFATSTSIPLPDTPVSSLSISDAKAAAINEVLANVSKGSKRKRIASSIGTTSKTASRVRPTPEECEFAVRELGKLHPDVIQKCREIRERTTITTNVASDCKIDKDIVKTEIVPENVGSTVKIGEDSSSSSCGDQTNLLDGVFSTMLSQNTTAANSTRAFGNFKKAVPEWNMVADDFDGYQQTIETAIHCGGLAQIKAANIIRLCRTIHEETDSVSLEYLRHKSNQEIQKDLLRHKGLGPKTVSCVLLFTLGRNEFPVDTHVYRIAKLHKWIPNSGMSRDAAYEYLNEQIPDHLKLELHCLLVQHGRECHRCAARGKPQFPPEDGSKLDCPLVHVNAVATGTHLSKKTKVKREL